MQISKVNSNHNYKTNQNQAFKGKVQQETFNNIVEAGLRDVLETSSIKKSMQPVEQHFTYVWEMLRRFYGSIYRSFNEQDAATFSKFEFIKPVEGAGAEKVEVRLYRESKNGPLLSYSETQMLEGNPEIENKDTERYTKITYYGSSSDNSVHKHEISGNQEIGWDEMGGGDHDAGGKVLTDITETFDLGSGRFVKA